MMKVSKDFVLQEFVPPETWERWGERSIWFIDRRVIDLAQALRDFTGKSVTINDWAWGGQYKYSGYRPPNCEVGASESPHRSGRGIDPKVAGMTPHEVAKLIKDKWHTFRALGLTTIEDPNDTPTWNHLDCRETGSTELLIVKG